MKYIEAEGLEMRKQTLPDAPAAAGGKRFGGDGVLTARHKLPLPEVDEALPMPEPDGTEDPGASVDDGLMPGPASKDGR